ncbi:hypothetical protein RS130_20805 [Paraglaciecola aquimarina]|uniref:Uncharacterized protein n=1 Tax=Paraglaciecola aquimarina TaxID=1235557 RepID=A0ABU3T181_9ALTE|nr:hypothetical protein [Paraglaciecola aquimarina]MDU0356008.1 hypothetical protein [Paraglaciecola aquimarina]
MSRYHYLLLVVLVVVSVCGIFTAYRYGIASVNFYNVKNSVEKWHSNPQDIDLQQYLEAKN